MSTKRKSPFAVLKAAIQSMLGRSKADQPKDAYVNRPPVVFRPPTRTAPIDIFSTPLTYGKSNQRKERKNRRRAFAAGNRKAFA